MTNEFKNEFSRQGVFFDLDETILDRSNSLRDFVFWQATKMLTLPEESVARFVNTFIVSDNNGLVWKDRVYTELISEFEISEWSMEELLNSYLLCFCAFCKPRPGIVHSIKQLHAQGFKLGIISNGKSPFQERNFRALGLAQYFDSVIVSEAVNLRKPDTEIYELACHTLQVNIKQSTMIGDSITADVEGAKNAGMRTIHVPLNPDSEPDSIKQAAHLHLALGLARLLVLEYRLVGYQWRSQLEHLLSCLNLKQLMSRLMRLPQFQQSQPKAYSFV